MKEAEGKAEEKAAGEGHEKKGSGRQDLFDLERIVCYSKITAGMNS